jgi:tetratricopeptide (TPR) repeat protein
MRDETVTPLPPCRVQTLAAWRASGAAAAERANVAREHYSLVLAAADRTCRERSLTDFSQADLAYVRGRLVERREGARHALPYFRHATALAPDNVVYRLALIELLQCLGCVPAPGTRQESRRVPPHDAPARDLRAVPAARDLVCTLARNRDEDSESLAAAWYSLGAALDEHGRLDEARHAFAVALHYQPAHVGARFARGNLHLKRAEYDRAIPWYREVLKDAPNHHGANYNLGWCHHLLGDYRRASQVFEQQDRRGPYVRRHFVKPDWRGERLDGALLLWSDQGLGDAIHFVRYLRLARQRVERVVLQCSEPLASLVAETSLADEIVGRRGVMPVFDAQAPLSWLPGIFDTSPSSIPIDVPYLRAPEALVDEWRERLGPGERDLLIGLSWTGDETSRSALTRFVSLDAFAPLCGAGRGYRFISLQHGRAAAALLAPPSGLAIESWREESRSLLDTAALIANLDLVITVDTMIAHLAGALARPVWTLLSHPADWRWGLAPTTCPWYPTMRLFRQEKPGDWGSVFARIAAAVAELAKR